MPVLKQTSLPFCSPPRAHHISDPPLTMLRRTMYCFLSHISALMAPEASALFGLFCISLVTLFLLLLQHTHTYTHTTALEIRLRMPKGRKAETMIQSFTSAAEFERFLVGCKLYHMRTTKGGDKHIAIITELDQAVAVSTTVGDFLMLDDPTVLLLDDVSNLKS